MKSKKAKVWLCVTSIIVVLLLILNYLTTSGGLLYDLACTLFGTSEITGRGEGFHYDIKSTSKQNAYELGNELNELICEEGFVLLKNSNNSLPISKGAKISVFGKNSVNIVYGGSGSGGGNYKNAPTLYDSLSDAGFSVNPTLKAFYEDDNASGSGRTSNPKIENSGNEVIETGETPQSSYTSDVISSYSNYNDAAIVVISRIGGEGFDLPRSMAGESDKHYLQLDKNEQALIAAVKDAGFKKVVVLINANTTMQIGELENDIGVDAIISMAGPGYSGVNAIGRILNGEVSPSGRTVDTWMADFRQDPTWNNFGNNNIPGNATTPAGSSYIISNGMATGYYYVDYEENIYVGYRYWETRGLTEGEKWYDDHVVYPFGFGLSYTDFSWEIVNKSELNNLSISDANKTKTISITVKVTNTGSVPGKDVVELYCHLPSGDIEKSSVVLCGFAKTDLIPAGKSDTVTIEFNPYFVSSYDCYDADGDGKKCYTLEDGVYALCLMQDSHNAKIGVDPVCISVDETVHYEQDPHTNTDVVNRFDDADDQLDTLLSRSDWEGTYPQSINNREISNELLSALNSTKTNNPTTDYEMPKMGVETDLVATDLRGLDYDDPKWEEFLDSFTFDELKNVFNRGAFKTYGIVRLGLPETSASDGPAGFTNFMSEANVSGNVSYACQYVVGCTWNVELAKAMGESIGEEAAWGNGESIPTPYTGWYAPGVNLHRSPFGGRNYEYYSEDPFLTGFMAAGVISGAESKGVITYMKHFALNEQETYRDMNGVATWASEQAIRELYLKPFEIAVKYGGASGIMSSFNRIGTKWTGGDYRLLTEVLRDEWGFEGAVICDFNVSNYMSPKQMVYAGGDLNLTTMRYWMRPDETDAGDVTVLRNAAHNVLYNVINSNAMNGLDENTQLHMSTPIWQSALYIIEAVIAAILLLWGLFGVLFSRRRI